MTISLPSADAFTVNNLPELSQPLVGHHQMAIKWHGPLLSAVHICHKALNHLRLSDQLLTGANEAVDLLFR